MAQPMSPWLMFPETSIPQDQQGMGPMRDMATLAPSVPKVAMNAPRPQRAPAVEPVMMSEEREPTLMDMIQASLARREDEAAMLRAEADNKKGVGGLRDVNLKPLIALTDSWNRTNLADSYVDPNIEKDKVRERLNMQAMKADEAAANDRLALAKMFSDDSYKDRRMDNLENLTAITAQRNNQLGNVALAKLGTDPKNTGEQFKAGGFARRLEQTDEILTDLGNQGYFGPSRSDQVKAFLPAEVQSNNYKTYDQTARNFINATLRRESGAAISEGEFANARQQYLPQPGDTPEIIAQKAANRAQVFQSFKAEGSNAFDKIPYVSPKTGKVAQATLGQTAMVKIQAPNGAVKMIPAGQLRAAIAAGGKQVP